jgi:hypothetical protein
MNEHGLNLVLQTLIKIIKSIVLPVVQYGCGTWSLAPIEEQTEGAKGNV